MNRIAELRKEQGMTQKELADKINVNYVTLSRYENGERNPKIDKLDKMADIFGVTVEYIIGRSNLKISKKTRNLMAHANFSGINVEGELQTESNNEVSLLYSYRQLNDDGKKEAIKQIRNLTKISDYRKTN